MVTKTDDNQVVLWLNSKCHRHQICIDVLYVTCFLNSKINSKSVDLPRNTMIPATFSTILWRIPTFQNKPAKTTKSPQPYHLSFLEAQGTGKLWKGHDLLVSHLQIGFISYFKIIQGTGIDPHFQILPFLNTCRYKFDHGHFEYFTPYCTLIPTSKSSRLTVH